MTHGRAGEPCRAGCAGELHGHRSADVAGEVDKYPKAEFPTNTVYGDIDHPGLRLIMCGGRLDSDAASYDDNIVVYADLIS